MATNVLLPQWGMGMQEGTVVEWLKDEGDAVLEDEPIVEVESEKTTEAVHAPASGILARIVVGEGQTAHIYDLLGIITAPGESLPEVSSPVAPMSPETAETPSASAGGAPDSLRDQRRQVEPRARRAARQHGIDIDEIRGSGPDGRVTEADVLRGIAAANGAQPSYAMSGKRAVTARRMTEAARTMALVTLTREVDVTELEIYREQVGGQYSVGYTDLIVKAAALALKGHPALNAHLREERLTVWKSVHVGVAVATEDGLVVPVIRDADGKSLRSIVKELRALTDRVRKGEASLHELTGSTFTVTNLGMYGIGAFTPIVNPPEVAILGVGRTDERAVRRDGTLQWRQTMTLSLTFDHRAVDGAPAAMFLQTVSGILEDPVRLGG